MESKKKKAIVERDKGVSLICIPCPKENNYKEKQT